MELNRLATAMRVTERPPHLPATAKRCEKCGEWIRLPVPRAGKMQIVCADCFGDDHGHSHQHVLDVGAKKEMAYHGGQFSRGEW